MIRVDHSTMVRWVYRCDRCGRQEDGAQEVPPLVEVPVRPLTGWVRLIWGAVGVRGDRTADLCPSCAAEAEAFLWTLKAAPSGRWGESNWGEATWANPDSELGPLEREP